MSSSSYTIHIRKDLLLDSLCTALTSSSCCYTAPTLLTSISLHHIKNRSDTGGCVSPTWCAPYVLSPRWSLLPTSAPALIRHSETQSQRRVYCTNTHTIFQYSETHSRMYAVPQSQGLSPSRPPLQPPSRSRCGPRPTSTSGEVKSHEPRRKQYTIKDWFKFPQPVVSVYSQCIYYYG